MNCSWSHKKLITFGFSMLMTLAFFAAAPQGFATDSSGTNSTNATSTPPLSAAQLKKLVASFAQHGEEREIGPVAAEKLGIPSAQYRQITLLIKKSGSVYVLILLPNDELIVSYLNQTTAYSYRLDSNFKVLRSVAMTDNVPSEVKDPQTDAKSILATWARFADKLPD